MPVHRLAVAFLALVYSVFASAGPAVNQQQAGQVLSGPDAIAFATVTLYRAGSHQAAAGSVPLGRATTDATGHFEIYYQAPADPGSVLYLVAEGARTKGRNSPVALAAVLDNDAIPADIIINERTTVAMAYALAHFTRDRQVGGKYPGLINAAGTAQNLADLATGGIGTALGDDLNSGTSTLPAFNSLANMLAACVDDSTNCAGLFAATTPPRGPAPTDTWQAIVSIAQHQWRNALALFAVSKQSSRYQPTLPPAAEQTAWTLAIRYNGDGSQYGDGPGGQRIDGPGNIALDSHGNAWINNNYQFSPDTNPSPPVCGSTKLMKLTPTGRGTPGAPFGSSDGSGVGSGGLYGAGFGITLDPDENVWVSNFGFKGNTCTDTVALLAVSVSQFDADGNPLSPDGDPSANPEEAGGYTDKDDDMLIQQPQGIVSDREGDIWVANCITDSVTRFPKGNPEKRVSYDDIGIMKPFDIAFDTRGHAWVTGNDSDNVVELDRNGHPVGDLVTDPGIRKPMGIATDSRGNMWVANAGVSNPPCPAILSEDEIGDDGSNNKNASVTLIQHNGKKRKITTFDKSEGTREGLRWPWGISVDGNDNVWVANFAGQRIMQLCGLREKNCPPGKHTGDPISPDSGYSSNALQRVTAVEIDPSGNLWATNNWIIPGFNTPENPGGHEVVVFVGIAEPIRTPLIGPPERP